MMADSYGLSFRRSPGSGKRINLSEIQRLPSKVRSAVYEVKPQAAVSMPLHIPLAGRTNSTAMSRMLGVD